MSLLQKWSTAGCRRICTVVVAVLVSCTWQACLRGDEAGALPGLGQNNDSDPAGQDDVAPPADTSGPNKSPLVVLPDVPAPGPAPNANTQPEPVPEQPAAEEPVATPTATVQFMGRFDSSDANNRGVLFSWPASTIAARFFGTGISVALADNGKMSYAGVPVVSHFNVYIDGKLQPTLALTPTKTEYVLAENLPAAEHHVRLVKRTEAQLGSVWFKGFTPHGEGRMLQAPSPSARRLEFIGDSITAGYGADGNVASPIGCTFTDANENADITFAAVTAANLKADFAAIGFSGKGILQNVDCVTDTYNTMPILYRSTVPLRSQAMWDFNSWVPQAVVVNLGTNDYKKYNGCPAPDDARFVQAWVALVQQIRKNYPAAQVFCTVGPDLYEPELSLAQRNIQTAVSSLQAAGDANVSVIVLPFQDGTRGWGCGAHPNKTYHDLMADIVTAALRKKLGW